MRTILIVILIFLASVGVVALVFRNQLRLEKLKKRLSETGRRASATVLEARQTGAFMDDRPQIRLRLRVQPDDAPAFEATVVDHFGLLDVPKVQEGAAIAVLYDPADPAQVVVRL